MFVIDTPQKNGIRALRGSRYCADCVLRFRRLIWVLASANHSPNRVRTVRDVVVREIGLTNVRFTRPQPSNVVSKTYLTLQCVFQPSFVETHRYPSYGAIAGVNRVVFNPLGLYILSIPAGASDIYICLFVTYAQPAYRLYRYFESRVSSPLSPHIYYLNSQFIFRQTFNECDTFSKCGTARCI